MGERRGAAVQLTARSAACTHTLTLHLPQPLILTPPHLTGSVPPMATHGPSPSQHPTPPPSSSAAPPLPAAGPSLTSPLYPLPAARAPPPAPPWRGASGSASRIWGRCRGPRTAPPAAGCAWRARGGRVGGWAGCVGAAEDGASGAALFKGQVVAKPHGAGSLWGCQSAARAAPVSHTELHFPPPPNGTQAPSLCMHEQGPQRVAPFIARILCCTSAAAPDMVPHQRRTKYTIKHAICLPLGAPVARRCSAGSPSLPG